MKKIYESIKKMQEEFESVYKPNYGINGGDFSYHVRGYIHITDFPNVKAHYGATSPTFLGVGISKNYYADIIEK